VKSCWPIYYCGLALTENTKGLIAASSACKRTEKGLRQIDFGPKSSVSF
jgi:hypothetical protein